MKKNINGKMYDTGKAVLVDTYKNKHPLKDPNWVRERLYRKRTGEFFIYGEGGTQTRYARLIADNEWSKGSEIVPLTFEAARKWAENHISANTYENLFGRVYEDEVRKSIGISIATSTHEKAKREASRKGISLSEYIEKLILENAKHWDQNL